MDKHGPCNCANAVVTCTDAKATSSGLRRTLAIVVGPNIATMSGAVAWKVARSITSRDVIDTLGELFAMRGVPRPISSDNGPEFLATGIRRWLEQVGVGTLYVEPGSPWQNGYAERFHSFPTWRRMDARFHFPRAMCAVCLASRMVPSATCDARIPLWQVSGS